MSIFRRTKEDELANLLLGSFRYYHSELSQIGLSVVCEDSYFYNFEDEFAYKAKIYYGEYSYDVVVLKCKRFDEDVIYIKHKEISRIIKELPFIGNRLYDIFNKDDKNKRFVMLFAFVLSIVSLISAVILSVKVTKIFLHISMFKYSELIIGVILTMTLIGVCIYSASKFIDFFLFRI